VIEIRPMDENYILPCCLHSGPIDASDDDPPHADPIDLPDHPWIDETIRVLAAKHGNLGHGGEAPAREFMREMIWRYGTCALLAWEGRSVVGFIRFYPMTIARRVADSGGGDLEPVLDCRLACEPGDDERTLWVQCVMASRPYAGSQETVFCGDSGPTRFPGAHEAGARTGTGLKLAQALIPWAEQHGWRRIVKVAHCDLDVFYGMWGGGGKTFWEKAGCKVVGTIHKPQAWSDELMAVLRSQLAEKGMAEEEAWTYYRMVYEV
jgi:hypothetical protein